jgi:hypothetical protein
MNNKLTCRNCSLENPLFGLNCNNCQAFLRAKIPNIDFWDTVWSLLVNPVETAKRIIQADKKNYIFFLLIIILIKTSSMHFIVQNYIRDGEINNNSFTNSLLSGSLLSVVYFILFGSIITVLFSFLKIETRFKDNFSILMYSFTPILIGFLFLTPIHFALYGKYWFTINPSPLLIKPVPTYILYGIESVLALWVVFLLGAVLFAQSKRIVISILLSILLFASYITLFLIRLL